MSAFLSEARSLRAFLGRITRNIAINTLRVALVAEHTQRHRAAVGTVFLRRRRHRTLIPSQKQLDYPLVVHRLSPS